MRSAVTVSLVPEARGGPFVFWDDLAGACRRASQLGFDAIEIFPPSPEAIDRAALRKLLDEFNLKVAAFGTGAGWVKQRLHLCLPDENQRSRARQFIQSIIDLAGEFSAPAIIGSMQGRSGEGVDATTAMAWLTESLDELGRHAMQYGTRLLYEPLNRYETNMCTTLGSGVKLLDRLSTRNVLLLADLFHMNIEEANIAEAIQQAKGRIGHVHFVDSNRRPAGNGHLALEPIVAALRETGYEGYLSAEAFPYPDSESAAKQTIDMFRQLVR